MASTYTVGDLQIEKPELGDRAWKPIIDSNSDKIDTAVTALNRRVGTEFANIVDIKNIQATQYADGMRVWYTGSTIYTLYVFHTNSVLTGDDDGVLHPNDELGLSIAGPGRWIKNPALSSNQYAALGTVSSASNPFATVFDVNNAIFAQEVLTITDLQNVPAVNRQDYQIRYVVDSGTGEGANYKYFPANTQTADNSNVVDPADHTGGAVGRWLLDAAGGGGANLNAISEVISGITNITCVFIYDTAHDSDGGEWRYHTEHTSWEREFQETGLDTSVRGGTSRFPVKSCIISTNTKLYVYSLDEGRVSFWIRFDKNTSVNATDSFMLGLETNSTISCLTAKNGRVYVGCAGTSGGFYVLNFVEDKAYKYTTLGVFRFYTTMKYRNTANVNVHTNTWETLSVNTLSHDTIHSVDVSVNDSVSALATTTYSSIPEIVIATDVGLDYITKLGTHITLTNGAPEAYHSVRFSSFFDVIALNETQLALQVWRGPVGASQISVNEHYSADTFPRVALTTGITHNNLSLGKNDEVLLATTNGLIKLQRNITNLAQGKTQYFSSTYWSGVLYGECILSLFMSGINTGTEIDRSGSGNTPTLNGAVFQNRVATNTEWHSVEGFGASTFYTLNDVTLGATFGDFQFVANQSFSVMCWFQSNSASVGIENIIRFGFHTGGNWVGPGWSLDMEGGAGQVEFSIRAVGNTDANGGWLFDGGAVPILDFLKTTDTYRDDTFHFLCGVLDRNTNQLRLSIDGVPITPITTTKPPVNLFGSSPLSYLRIGTPQDGTSAVNVSSKLAGLRILKHALTDTEAASIYTTEKYMFQEKAQFSLVGTVDSCSAVTYNTKQDTMLVSGAGGLTSYKNTVQIATNTALEVQSATSMSSKGLSQIISVPNSVTHTTEQTTIQAELTQLSALNKQEQRTREQALSQQMLEYSLIFG